MSAITSAIYNVMAQDTVLTDDLELSKYEGNPAIFTTDPAPEGAVMPYIVSAGPVSQIPFDTKTTEGREIVRDIRIYDDADTGSVVRVEALAERVRALFHRVSFPITGYQVIVSNVDGPFGADERDAYGRLLSLNLKIEEV